MKTQTIRYAFYPAIILIAGLAATALSIFAILGVEAQTDATDETVPTEPTTYRARVAGYQPGDTLPPNFPYPRSQITHLPAETKGNDNGGGARSHPTSLPAPNPSPAPDLVEDSITTPVSVARIAFDNADADDMHQTEGYTIKRIDLLKGRDIYPDQESPPRIIAWKKTIHILLQQPRDR